ncbi:unnamed protein product [Cercopithifilaria johnstoni]|uniref:Cadherin domain-containing protein n=1 Tax=Cercopithifilaria johnstoni TaxID=2874296 RepID=A0A8J2Q836_9BILA|nr:unnamed protein product [Cercopithifilaria johnstoni]
MLIWLCILFASNTCGQIPFKQTDENEIFDVNFGRFIAGADLLVIRNEPNDEMPDNLKKDGINNQDVFGKQSSEDDMMSVLSNGRVPEKLALPVLDKSLMIAAGKISEEMVKEFKDEKMKSASIEISQTDGSIQQSTSQMSGFLHGVEGEDTVEKMVQDSNFIHVNGNSSLSEPHVENSSDFLTLNAPIYNLKIKTVIDDPSSNTLNYTAGNLSDTSIIWSNPHIFVKPIHIAKFHSGHEILSVKAYDMSNNSIEFICMLPEVVFCVTDLLSNDSYRLRVVYTGSTSITNFNLPLIIRTRSHGGNLHMSWNASINFVLDDKIQSEISSITTQQTTEHQAEAIIDNEFHMQPNFIASEEQPVPVWNSSTIQPERTMKPKAPVFIFIPHFEHSSYEIYVPEGKNKDSMIVAIVYFLTYLGDVEAKFSIQSEPLQWFYLGEMEKKTNANRLIIAIKLMLQDGADIDSRKTNHGQYKFQIKANQGSFETTTDINVEVLTFATKGNSYSSVVTTISSATETLMMDEFTTLKFLTDSEHHAIADSMNISGSEPEIITVNIPIMEQIDTVTAHESWNIKITQAEPTSSASETTSETFVEKLDNIQGLETTESIVKIHNSLELSRVGVSQRGRSVERLSSFPEEFPVREDFSETFQSTVHDTEAIANTAKSTTEKGSGRSFFLQIKETGKHQSESVAKASPSSVNIPLFKKSFGELSRKVPENWTNFPLKEISNKKQIMNEFQPLQEYEIISVTPPESFWEDGFTHTDHGNLNAVYYNSVSSERGTSSRNALTTEMDYSSKDNEFRESNDNFSSYSQEQLLVDNKLTTAVVSSVQNDNNLFPNIPVENRKSLQDKFGTSVISMTTTSVSGSDGNIDNLPWSSQNDKYFNENFGKLTPNFKTSMDIQLNYATTMEPERSINTGVDNNDIDSDLNTSVGNTNSAIRKDHIDHISTINNDVDATVTSSDSTEAIGVDRSTDATILQPTLISLTDNMNMNSDYKVNESSNENFETDKLEQIQLVLQQTDSVKTTVAAVLHPETVRIEANAKREEINKMQSQETTIDVKFKTIEGSKYVLPNEFRDSDILPDLDIIITANNMDPNDVIMVSVNSSSLEVIPRRMQPGKSVFLAVRDAEKLDRELLDGFVVVKVTASQRTRPSVTSSKVINIIRDENLSNELPVFLFPEYDFHVNEGSITGQKVGQMEAEFMNRRGHGIITYQLIGPGSELFAVNGGTVSVSCPSVLPCLDREQTAAYHLLAIVTDRNGLKSAPAIVKIFINDRNDNGPILETSQNEITVSNGRLTKPFVVKVKDNDIAPHNINEISIDGTASAFISLEKVRDNIYYGRLWSLPAAGIYQLIITARDPDGNIPEQRLTVKTQVLNTVTKAHFKRTKYERTVNTEKLFKDNSILQPELENAPLDALRFILLRDDPGWLSVDEYNGNVIVGDVPRTGIVSGKYSTSIAAVNRTDGRIITESVLVLTVINNNHVKKLFTKKLIVKTVRKDSALSRQTVEILPEHNKASITIIRDSISAIDEQLHYIHLDKNAISSSYGMIIMDMKRLQQARILQFNLSSKEDANDSAEVMLFLSSEPVEMAHERKRQAQPRFGHPWRSDMNIIPIKLAENSPEGYTIISLPAYNPMNGTKVMDLKLSGEMAQHFTVDGRSGDVQVLTPFDFEAMEPESHTFDLLLIAGEEPYDTVAVLRVEIIDVDDNPPKIAKFGDYNFDDLKIAENSRPGTVLFEVQISDPDYLYGKTGVFNYALSGNGAANFQVKKINDTVAVIVSPAADLDREKVEKMVVLLKVIDSGGNSDSVVGMITITDVNDNVPVFIHNEYKVEAVENWPEAMILTHVHAEDKDKGLNADIRYSLSPKNNQYFEIDPINGLIRAKKALIGLARAHPYDFSVLACDQGIPPLSASTTLSIHVLESTSLSHAGDNKGIHIVSPSVHFTLQLDENTPANDRIYSVRAKIGGFNEQFGREIKYSITPVDNATDGGWFTIDANSGDLFTLQELDYELQPAITVSLF